MKKYIPSIIHLTKAQKAYIKDVAKKDKISISELVRDVINAYQAIRR